MTRPQSSGSENIVLKLDAIAQDYEALIHFTPTADQRRAFASSGWAMPDGSFFIRPMPMGSTDLDNAISAVGRATPNAGESDVARRNAVRRHIMKRARAIKQSNKIPDTWNSDGSLKQSAVLVQEVEEFLQHFGVKGMKWGLHIFGDENTGPSKKAVKRAAKTTTEIKDADEQIGAMKDNLSTLKTNQKIMEGHLKRFGEQGKKLNNPDVMEALLLHNEITKNIKIQQDEIDRMQKHRDKLRKSLAQTDLVEEFLEHFGVKGMKWGVRRGDNAGSGGGGSSNHPSLNAPKSRISSDANLARNLQTQVRRSGTQSLSNKELQQLVTRLNLERQYGQVSQAQVGQGRKFVTGLLLSIGKQTAASFAQKYAAQGVEALIKKASKK